jgi:hypothetical protein
MLFHHHLPFLPFYTLYKSNAIIETRFVLSCSKKEDVRVGFAARKPPKAMIAKTPNPGSLT